MSQIEGGTRGHGVLPGANIAAEGGVAGNQLFTRNFVLLCLSTLTFFGSFYFFLPTLPVYVMSLGAKESEVGLIMGVFTISSVLLRPFIGQAVDERGSKLFMLIGSVVFLISSVLYNFAVVIPLLMLLRVFHGSGIASFTTASSVLVADTTPPQRRGEAMGYFGMFNNLSMAVGPAIGVFIVQAAGYNFLFLTSAAVAVVALFMVTRLYEKPKPVRTHEGPRPKAALFSRKALFPAAVLWSFAITYGATLTYLPLFAVKEGLGNPGLFFTVYAIVLIIIRTWAGKLSDTYGRAAVIIPGMLFVVAAMWLLAFSTNIFMLFGVAVLFGTGFASVQPTLMAYTIDRVGPQGRGAAMGTFTAAFDLGIASGSILLGFVAQWGGYESMYLLAGAIVLVGLIGFAIGNWVLSQPAGGVK